MTFRAIKKTFTYTHKRELMTMKNKLMIIPVLIFFFSSLASTASTKISIASEEENFALLAASFYKSKEDFEKNFLKQQKEIEEMVNTLYLVRPKKQETIFKAKLEDLYKYNSNTLAKAILSGKLEFDLQKNIPNIKYPENRECTKEGCRMIAKHGRFANLLMCRGCYHREKTSDTWNAAKQCKACGRYYYWDSNGVCPCKSF